MARPWRIRYSGAKYHVTSRGNGRQSIFLEETNYDRFLKQLELALEKDEVTVYAFCLMPNHYHLFVETPRGNINRFMQRLNTAYSMYFRYKCGRPGHCLQGRYGAKLVGGDEYIVRLTRYIHLNPVETQTMRKKSLAERKQYLRSFPWSSYPGYVSKEAALEMVDYRWLSMMERKTESGCRRAYKSYAEGMIGRKDDILHEALDKSRYAIGDREFTEEAENDLKEMKLNKATYGDIVLPDIESTEPKVVDEAVAIEFGVGIDELHCHGHKAGVAKSVAVELCCALTSKTQREIVKYYGYRSDGGVAGQRRAFRRRASEDPALFRRIEKLKRKLMRSRSKI